MKRFVYYLLYIALSVVLCGTSGALPVKTDKSARVLSVNMVNYDAIKMRVIHSFSTPYNTHIALLEGSDGKRYIVKQDTRSTLRWHISVARDMLGSLVAKRGNIRANFVSIIPAYRAFSGKRNTNWPATLHEVVPGMQVNCLPKMFKAFRMTIQQHFFKSPVHAMQPGLTRDTIKNMSFHPDLAEIAAMDTFIANGDRHRGNFFYDPTSNHYYAIDLESSFNKNLAVYACDLIRSMIDYSLETVSPQELRALLVYRNTLKKLLSKHSPAYLFNRLAFFASHAGGGRSSQLFKTLMHSQLKKHERAIKDNYRDCEKLVVLLDKLFKKYRVRVK